METIKKMLIEQNATKEQFAKIAIFSAEQVLKIYEKDFPKDRRPRQAIEAATKRLNNPLLEKAATVHVLGVTRAAHEASKQSSRAASFAVMSAVYTVYTAYAPDAKRAKCAVSHAISYALSSIAYTSLNEKAMKAKISDYAIEILRWKQYIFESKHTPARKTEICPYGEVKDLVGIRVPPDCGGCKPDGYVYRSPGSGDLGLSYLPKACFDGMIERGTLRLRKEGA